MRGAPLCGTVRASTAFANFSKEEFVAGESRVFVPLVARRSGDPAGISGLDFAPKTSLNWICDEYFAYSMAGFISAAGNSSALRKLFRRYSYIEQTSRASVIFQSNNFARWFMRIHSMRWLTCCFLLCGQLSVAQSPPAECPTFDHLTWSPPSPTAADVIEYRIEIMGGIYPTVFPESVSGYDIGLTGKITLPNVGIIPPGEPIIGSFGPLSAGQYRVLLQYEYQTMEYVPDRGWVMAWAPCPVHETTLTVSAAPYQYIPVPIDSRWLLTALAILLVSAGWMARRRGR